MLAVFLVLIMGVLCEFAGGILLKGIYHARLGRRTRGKLILTYDDGPGVRLESSVVELLKQENVRATFFLNAKRSLDHRERAGLLKEAGHEVACHTWEHPNAWRTPPWRCMRDVTKAYAILEGWLTTASIYRPPYGRITLSTWLRLTFRGVRIALWTQDSGDTWPQLPELSTIIAEVRRAGGGVVLMHSFDRRGDGSEQREQYVLELTARLLRMARQEQWRVCCFSEIMERDAPNRTAQGRGSADPDPGRPFGGIGKI